MSDAVKIVECPRDAWQGLPGLIPPAAKAAYLRELIDAGFTYIDAVSFVSPVAVPQMADSESVLEFLKPPKQIDVIGIVVNRKGAERAVRTGAVRTLGFPYSISPEFLRRNQHQTPGEALLELRQIVIIAREARLEVAAYRLHGLRESLRRSVEHTRRAGCVRSSGRLRRAAGFTCGHGGAGITRSDC